MYPKGGDYNNFDENGHVKRFSTSLFINTTHLKCINHGLNVLVGFGFVVSLEFEISLAGIHVYNHQAAKSYWSTFMALGIARHVRIQCTVSWGGEVNIFLRFVFVCFTLLYINKLKFHDFLN